MNTDNEPDDVSLKLGRRLAAFHDRLIRTSLRSPSVPPTVTDHGAAASEVDTPSPATPRPHDSERLNESLSPIRAHGSTGPVAAAENGVAQRSDSSLEEVDDDIDLDDENLLADCMKCVELLDRVRRRALPESLVELTFAGDPDEVDLDAPGELDGELVPRQIGRYQILRQIGAGGLGMVFEAFDPKLNREVALKIPRLDLLLSKSLRRRFVLEAEAASRINHPNLVGVYDTGEEGPFLYIASEYCPGVNLAEWLAAQTEVVPVRQAVTIVRQLADGVSHAHARGILHRDIKPSNVMVSIPSAGEGRFLTPLTPNPSPAGGEGDQINTYPAGGEGDRHLTVKLGDFGLAKLVDQEVQHTRSGQVLGTVAYMSPEQAEGKSDELDIRTDVYSLGIVLYQLLTGRVPFEGKSGVAAIAAVVSDEPPAPRNLRKNLPRDLEAICLKCIAKRKEDRYATANELAQDLDRFLEGKPTVALPATAAQRVVKWVKRKPTLAALYGVILASLVSLLAFYVRSDLQLRSSLERELIAKRTARVHTYATEMAQAQQYYDEGNVPLLLDTLKRYLPQPGEDDLRTFPWFHLWHKVHQAERTLVGHEGDVHSVSYSPDGNRLISSGADGTVRLWDVSSGGLLKTFKVHDSGCNVVRYLPSGSEAVSVGDDGRFMRMDLVGDAPLELIWQSEHSLEALGISKDGQRAIVGDKFGTATVFSTATWELEHSWKPHTDNVYVLDFSPDGTMLLTGCRSGGVVLWNVPEWTLIDQVDEGKHHISSAGFSPDGQYVRISYRARGETEVLKLKIVDRRAPAKAPGPFFRSLGMVDGNRPTYAKGISGDGKVVVGFSTPSATNQKQKRAFYWTEESGFQFLGGSGMELPTNEACAVSEDGSVIVGHMDDPVCAFQWSKEKGIAILPDLPGGEIQSIANDISADGTVIAGRSYSDRGFEPVRWVDGKVESLLPREGSHVGALYRADAEVVSADGLTIAGKVSQYNESVIELFVWNAQDGMQRIRLPQSCTSIAVRAISRDGQVIAGHGEFPQDLAWIWTEEAGFDFLANSQVGSRPIQDVCGIASDGSFLIGWRDTSRGVRVFVDTRTQDSFWGGASSVRPLQDACEDLGIESVIPAGWNITWISGISADGRRMVGYGSSPAGQQESCLIDLPANEDLGPVVGQRILPELVGTYHASQFSCYSSVFSPDSQSIIVSDERGTIECNDIQDGHYAYLRESTQRIWDLQVSPSDKQLASASADGTVKLWRLDRSQIQELITESESVPIAMEWSQDGRTLAIAYDNGSVRVHDANLQPRATAFVYEDRRDCENIAFSADSRRLYVGHPREEIICLDAITGDRIRNLGPESVGFDSIAESSDGTWLIGRKDNNAVLLSLRGQPSPPSIQRPGEFVDDFATSPCDPLVAIAFNKWIELWDLSTHRKLRNLDGHFRTILALAFSSDGKRLASSGDDQEIRIWDVETGECLATIVGLQARVRSLSWCADGWALVSSDANGQNCLWDIRTRQLLLRKEMNHRGEAQFSPDGQTLLLMRVHHQKQIEILRAPRFSIQEPPTLETR